MPEITLQSAQPERVRMTIEQVNVVNAVSPRITDISRVEGGTRITVEDIQGIHTMVIPDGATGPKGDTGNGIASAVLNSDYTLTLTFTDGTSYTTPPIRGAVGEKGNGIASAILNSDYTLTLTFTDGTSYTTPSIRGQIGETGNGIASAVLNPDYTLTLTFTDGTTYTTPSIRGAQGADGFSPTVTVTEITGGHEVTITDAAGDHAFDVLDGQSGADSDDKAPVILETASGDLVTITDGAEGLPVKSLTVDASATTLTRCGKNFFDEANATVTAISPVYNSDGQEISGTRRGFYLHLPAGTYTIHAEHAYTAYLYCNVLSSDYSFKSYSRLTTASGLVDPTQFTIEQGDILAIFKGSTTGNVTISGMDIQIERGTEATDTVPYAGKVYTLVDGQPTEPVTTLLGVNHLWADTGSVSVEYRADTELFVEQSIEKATPEAPVQDVQVNGASVLSGGVANIPEASANTYGVVKTGTVSVSGTTPTITALSGIQYVCGEVSTLDITLPASGIVDVVFQSGSTPTVLTITPPTGMTVEWTNGFDSTALEADTLYEINIKMVSTKCLGVAGAWS